MGGFHTVCEDTDQTGQELDKITYDGQRFIIPSQISFENQSRFIQIQQAARNFCHKNRVSSAYVPVMTRIIAYRHEKVFQSIWEYLQESQRQEFLQDMSTIQHDLMDSLYYYFVQCKKCHFAFKQSDFFQPSISTVDQNKKSQYMQTSAKLFQSNKVAMVFMCAGSSLRFGEDKVLFPFGQSKTCLLDLMFLRLRHNTKGLDIPIIVNCSSVNIQKIQNHLMAKQFYGFQSIKIRCFVSKSLAVYNNKKQYCINKDLRFIKRAAGTAYSALHIMNTSKLNSFLNFQGVQYVCFSGMENIMQNPCDPLFLGMMAEQKRSMGAKCVQPKFSEKFPRYYRTNKNSSKISFLNETHLKVACKEAQRLPIGINSMIFKLQVLSSLISDFTKYMFLAQHYDVIDKQEIVYNPLEKIAERMQCVSFEKDIRFLVSCCENPLIYKVDRQKQYIPILTKKRYYSFQAAYQNYGELIEKEIKTYSQQFRSIARLE